MKSKAYRKGEENGRTTYTPCEPSDGTHVMVHFPEPVGTMMLGYTLKGSRDDLTTQRGEPVWTWNGDCEKPTIRPSILTEQPPAWRFHCWLGDGLAEVLNDCYGSGICERRGQKVELLDVLE